MAEAFTAQAVAEACAVLYSQAPDPSRTAAADSYMRRFQESPAAWEVCDQMLNTDALPAAATFFAVQTLRAKVADSFDELPAEAVLPFRDAMLAHLTKHREGGRAVVTQLCLSVAGIAVQCEVWADPVGDLNRAFSQSAETIPCLLELLKLLPEESRNTRLHVPDSRRHLFTSAISAYFEEVRAVPCPCLRCTPHPAPAPAEARTLVANIPIAPRSRAFWCRTTSSCWPPRAARASCTLASSSASRRGCASRRT